MATHVRIQCTFNDACLGRGESVVSDALTTGRLSQCEVYVSEILAKNESISKVTIQRQPAALPHAKIIP